MRFLAVDDDPLFLQLLTLRMQALGYTDLVTVSSGADALALLSTAPDSVDCILSDIRMPLMDGITLCRNIRALPGLAKTPIVMITSMSDRSYIDEAFEAGATDYITKPLDRLGAEGPHQCGCATLREKPSSCSADIVLQHRTCARL